MKILLTIFVLLLSSLVFADDISDFQIERMGIGDSLLQFYTKLEISNAPNYNDLPSDMEFTIIEMPKKGKYEMLQIFYKTNDNNYKIASIGGAIFMDINRCIKEVEQIVDDISSTINNVNVHGPTQTPHPDDPSGESYSIRYTLKINWGYMFVECYHFSNQVHWEDNMRVSILNNATKEWVDRNYGLN